MQVAGEQDRPEARSEAEEEDLDRVRVLAHDPKRRLSPRDNTTRRCEPI